MFFLWVLLLLISALFHHGQLEYGMLFQFSYICWDFLCVLICDQFWRKFHRLGERHVFLVFVCNVWSMPARSTWFMTSFDSSICLILVRWPVYWREWGIKGSHYNHIWVCLCVFFSNTFCFKWMHVYLVHNPLVYYSYNEMK